MLILWLAATERMIRREIEPVDLLEQNIDVFYEATTPNAAFGDSIAAAGFLPDSPSIVNLASSGEPLAGTLIKVKGYFREKAPGRVIVAANHTMMRRSPGPQVDYEQIFYKRERDPLRIMEARHRNQSFLYWHTYLFRGFEAKRLTLPYGGEVFSNSALNRRFAEEPAAARSHAGAAKAISELPDQAERTEANKALFEELLDFLAERGADTCVVGFPMSPSFRREADRHAAFAAIRQWYQDVALRYGARYRDFWDHFEEDAFFMDPTHLTEAGGRAFTRQVLPACFGSAYALESGQ